jgi:putative ABC transport system ATP-binding protein
MTRQADIDPGTQADGGPGPTGAGAPVACAVVDGVKRYGTSGRAVTALAGVTVEFPVGRLTAIIGPSGSGKSTLMHCAAGLDRLTSGRVLLGCGRAATELGRLNDRQLTMVRRTRIGFVFQAFNLIPALTAVENITLPLELAGRRPDRELLAEVLDRLQLTGRIRHRPGELSGGEQQRVAIARTLVGQPEIIFADEPTGNLDSRVGGEVLELLRDLVRQLGRTLVMVTHDPVAASYADSAVVLADGRVVDVIPEPTTDQMFERMRRGGRAA